MSAKSQIRTGHERRASRGRTLFSEFWPAVVAGAAALALYARTLAPGLTWSHNGADGGDLLAAALTHGVPHPPGYPLYMLVLQAALALFHGMAGPARLGNWLSAVVAALAVAVLADLARRSLPLAPWRPVVALVVALAWAASPALWSQAVITEVYTLQALAVTALLWLLWRWRAAVQDAQAGAITASGWPWLVAAALVFGLGLGNHLSLVLVLPGAAAWLWSSRRGLQNRPRWALPAVVAAMLGGLCVYLYLPFAASSHPAINWGNPSSPARLFWLVTADPYRGLFLGLPLRWLPGRLAAWAVEASRQYWPWGLAVAALGLWRLDQTDRAWWRCTGLVALAFSLFALGYNTADSYVYLIPAWIVGALWLAHGLAWLVDGAARTTGGSTLLPRLARPVWPTVASLVLVALLALPVASVMGRYREMDLSRDHAAEGFIADALAEALPGAAVLVASDEPTFALWYAVYGLRLRPDLTVINVNLCAYLWYREDVARMYPADAASVRIAGGADWPAFLHNLASGRPLYRAEPLPVEAPGFRERPAGPLVQLSPG